MIIHPQITAADLILTGSKTRWKKVACPIHLSGKVILPVNGTNVQNMREHLLLPFEKTQVARRAQWTSNKKPGVTFEFGGLFNVIGFLATLQAVVSTS